MIRLRSKIYSCKPSLLSGLFFLVTFLNSNPSYAEVDTDAKSNTTPIKQQVAKASVVTAEVSHPEGMSVEDVSKAFGHYLGEKLLAQDLALLDSDAVIIGIRERLEGKKMPLSKKEYENALEQLQQKQRIKKAAQNLETAEHFLKVQMQKPNIEKLANGKVLIEKTKIGTGKKLTSHRSGLVRFQVKRADGSPLTSAQNDEPVVIHLDEVLPGIRMGMEGMQEGEMRTLYIHPDEAYGQDSLYPNALLVVDVELLSTNIPFQESCEPCRKPTDGKIAVY